MKQKNTQGQQTQMRKRVNNTLIIKKAQSNMFPVEQVRKHR